MEESKGDKFVCEFCDKKFPSGKSRGGHMRIHTKKISADSDNPKENKSLVDRREIVLKEPISCAKCCKVFLIFNDLYDHVCHSGSETSSAYESDQERGAGLSLMKMSRVSNSKKEHNLLVKNSNIKNQALETDEVAVDNQLRAADNDGVIILDSDSSDSDYPINDPKNSDADIPVDGSAGLESEIKNSWNRVRKSDELRVKEGRSKHDLSRSERAMHSSENGAHSLETDSLADTNSKIHRTSDRRSAMVNNAGGAKEKNEVHKCLICFEVFKSGPSLGGHMNLHTMKKKECPTCFKVFKSGQSLSNHKRTHKKQEHQTSELRVKEGGSKHDLSRSERALPSYENGEHSSETDSLTDTNSKIDRSSDKAGGAKNKNKVHGFPTCFKVCKSSQASEMRNLIDLNRLPASDIDEPEPEPESQT